MRYLFATAAAALAAFVAYLLVWPVRVEPLPWNPPSIPEATGALATNELLANTERLAEGEVVGPEDLAAAPDGRIVAGTADGWIILMEPGTGLIERWVRVPDATRINGVGFGHNGNLYACATGLGLVQVAPDGSAALVAAEVAGRPIRMANDLAITPDGLIYFSEATDANPETFPFERPIDELLEHRPRGRLLSYDPESGIVSQVATGFYFPNGVAASPDGRSVFVAETATASVHRVWINRSPPVVEPFISSLPGYPDNMAVGPSGRLWIAIAGPRSEAVDRIRPHPYLVKIVLRISRLIDMATPHAYVVAYSLDGEPILSLQDSEARIVGPITSVLEYKSSLYLGSHVDSAIGRIRLPLAE